FDIYEDNEKRFWVSTFSDGIKVLDYDESGFHTIKHEKNNNNSLHNDVVCAILEDSDRNFWYASNNGLSHYEPDTGKWKKLLHAKNILSLFEDSSNRIWVGTFSSGAYLLDKQGRILKNYITSQDENSIGTDFIYAVEEDVNGDIWFVGRRGKVSKLNVKTNKFTQGPLLQCNHIIAKDDKNMLISSEQGVFSISMETMKAQRCKFNDNLKSLYVEDMYLESDSIIWLATYGDGINRCNMISGRVQSFSLAQGLSSNIVNSFLIGKPNELWFSTDDGLGMIDIKTFQVINFSTADGVIPNKYRQVSRMKSHDGLLYFGANE